MEIIKTHIFALKRSFQLLVHRHFLLYFLPGIVLTIFTYLLSGGIMSLASSSVSLTEIPWIGQYLSNTFATLFGWLNNLTLYIHHFFILTLFSPLNTILSLKLDTHLTGKEHTTDFLRFIRELFRIIGIVLLGAILYLFFLWIWQFFAWIVGLSFLTPYISVIIVSFFSGFNSYDYSLERYGIGVLKSWEFAFKHPWYMLLTGGIFSAILYIPYIGIVIAPILLTMVGTINYLKISRIEIKENEK